MQAGAGVTPPPTIGSQIYMSGATFFTLGFGDVVPHTRVARVLTVLEAGTGLGFIAVVIGYLPVLYQLFSRREAHVIKLDGRAGSPPTALGLLQRHGGEDGVAQVDMLLREWETWGSELLESHLSYPMLAYYRSQHNDQSWLAALAAIIDCCSLILTGLDGVAPLQARMTFTMARQILVEMARSFGVAPSRYTGGDRLNHAVSCGWRAISPKPVSPGAPPKPRSCSRRCGRPTSRCSTGSPPTWYCRCRNGAPGTPPRIIGRAARAARWPGG